MKILIATDGSEFSETAVKTSCELIKNCESPVVKIVSVFAPPLMIAAAPYVVSATYNPILEREMDKAEQVVADVDRRIREVLPELKENLTTQILRGSPERSIVKEAERWSADLIVVGSHGYGFWERVFLGSVSSAVAHHAPCSVLIVRKKKISVSPPKPI